MVQFIQRVAHQVDQHLFDQHRIGLHLRQPGGHLDVHPHAAQVALEQRQHPRDEFRHRAALRLRRAPRQEGADALHDAPRLLRLLAQPPQRLHDDVVIRMPGPLQRAQRPRVVARDRRQRLVELVRQRRGHLAQRAQPRLVRQRLGAAALAFLGLLARADVDDRPHPADLHAVRIHQRRLEDHHVQLMAVAMHPARLVALARRAARHVALVAAQAVGHLVGQPVRHRRQAAQQGLRVIAHQVAERAVHMGQAAVQVPPAQAHRQ